MLISVSCIAAVLALNGAPVEREIEAKLGPCRVTQEGGRTVVELENRAYHVAKGASTRRDFWISNHTEDFTHPIGLDLRGATNLTIRGNGATVVFHDACVGVAIEDAANVKLENLKLTWSRPIVTEGEIVRFDKGETTVRIDPELFPCRVEKDALFAVGDGWEYRAALAMTFSGRTHEIVETTTDFTVKGAVRANADGTVTFAQDFSAGGKVKPGDILILRPRSRPYPAVFVYHAKDTLLEDVAIHTAWGMGLVAQMSENVTWRGTRTALDRTNGCFPPEGSKQVVTLHADASHFSNVKGAVTVENGLFETMLDDAVNVHSTCLGIVKVVDPKTIRCRYMHRQATGFGVFNPGDRLRFIRGKTLENDAETTVVAVAAHGHEEMTLTLRDALPGGIAAGDAVENADYQPSVVCRGNVIRNNRARGVLFTTPKPVVCESNVFDHVSGAAILFAGDAQGWYESGACADALVRGNVFTDCLTSPGFQFCDGVIASWPTIREPKAQKRHYHRNIRIEDNVFNTFDVPLLYARSTDGLVFRGNTVCTNAHYAGWGKGTFDVKDCDNAVLADPKRVTSLVSEVREHAGAPALWIDGKPVAGLMHWNRWITADDVAVFAKAGVHLYSFMGAPEMPNPSGGKTSYEDGLAKQPILTDDFVNRTMETIVAADPEAKVLVRLRLTTPDWWRKAHSNETVRVYNVHPGKFKQLYWGSPGSSAWRTLVEEAMRRTIRRIEARWADRVVGYHPGLVCCAENAYDWGGGIADWSEPNVRGFAEPLPDPEVFISRRLYDTRRLLNPVTRTNAVAFLRYQAEAMATNVCWLSHVVKDELRALGRTKVCGAFYGYMNLPQNQTDLFSSGHTAHAAVLNCRDIDFIAAPIDYSARQPGGAALPQALPASIAAHGKLYWAEEDSRFHRAKEQTWLCTSHDVGTTRNLLLRNFLDAYSHGGAIWWMDLFGEGWYREPSFTDAVCACRCFAAAHPDRTSAAEVAVFVHESAVHYERAAPIPLSNELVGPVLAEVAACGAPYDVFRLGDIPLLARSGKLARYRLAIVANAHAVDSPLRAEIRKSLCCDGRTVVWVGIPGYIRDNDAGAPFSAELTGIAVKDISALWSAQVETFFDGRRQTFGSTRTSDPQLVVSDPDATALGWFVHGSARFQPGGARGVALAKKAFPGWTSVVQLVNALPSDLVRRLAEEAGVHIYSPHGDQVFAGTDWFAVAAKMSGRHVLSAPWRKEPIVLDLQRGDCRIFEK